MTYRSQGRRLVTLAVPIILTQVGMNMLGVVDTIMAGRYSVEVLAAAALGHLWTFGTLIFAMGIVFGIDPIVTQAHGARDSERMGLALQRGLVVALIATLPTIGLWLATEKILIGLGQDPRLASLAHDYTVVQLPSVPFFLGFLALRQYLQGRGIVRPALLVVVASNLCNILFNWMFIFGRLGAPEMGIVGAGLATALTRGVMFGVMLSLVLRGRLYVGAWTPWSRRSLKPSRLGEILNHGVSIGIQYSLEVWAFQIVMLWAGHLGEAQLAAHSVVINMVSMSFMIPFGLSQATTTRVGNLLGEGRPREAHLAAWVALGLGGGAMCFFAVFFAVFRDALPRIYSADPRVILLGASILPIAAGFQIFDGIQAVGGGILRGMGRTRPAALFNLIGYYLLALPLAWWLGFRTNLGLRGLWWGLALGLLLIASTLLVWIRRNGPMSLQTSPAQ
jgi:MATE family multidrug resistance protein